MGVGQQHGAQGLAQCLHLLTQGRCRADRQGGIDDNEAVATFHDVGVDRERPCRVVPMNAQLAVSRLDRASTEHRGRNGHGDAKPKLPARWGEGQCASPRVAAPNTGEGAFAPTPNGGLALLAPLVYSVDQAYTPSRPRDRMRRRERDSTGQSRGATPRTLSPGSGLSMPEQPNERAVRPACARAPS